MNKYELRFKDQEIEQTYQKKQNDEVRKLTINVITLGLFINYLVIVLNSIAMQRWEYLLWKIMVMGYIVVQYYVVKKYPSLIRIAFILTNHINCLLFIFASDDSFTHEFDIIKGANQMGVEIIIVLSGEFVDAVFSILSLNLLRMVYGILHSPIQFYVPHVTTAILIVYFIYFFYKFHYARRSQFLLTLIDSSWDQILANLIQNQSYVVFTFNEEQLQFQIKQINNCNKLFVSKQDVFQFLRESTCYGKTVEQIIYQEIKNFQLHQKKKINVNVLAQYQKEIYRLKYSIFSGESPTLLLIFKGNKVQKKKNRLAKFDYKYHQFIALFIKVLNNLNPNQTQFMEYLQLKRQLYFFKLLGGILDNQFGEKLVNLSQNLVSVSSLFPDKRIFFENVDSQIQFKTIGSILYFFQMMVLEHSIGQGVKINYVIHSNYISLTFQGTFNYQKLKYITQQLQFPLKMIISNFNLSSSNVTVNFHSEPLTPFTRLQAKKIH